MKPICVGCQRFYRPKKNGFYFIEGKPIGGSLVPAGLVAPELWEPYKLWIGDLWSCPDCSNEIIVGTGMNPVSQCYKPDFKETVKAFDASLIINDC